MRERENKMKKRKTRFGIILAAALVCIVCLATIIVFTNARYYKWSFRGLRQLFGMEKIADKLSFVLLGDCRNPKIAEEKYRMIEDIATDIISVLQYQNLTDAICGDLEKHAYSVNDRISDVNIRTLNIMAAV